MKIKINNKKPKQIVCVRLEPTTLFQIDKLAKKNGNANRSRVIEALLTAALESVD